MKSSLLTRPLAVLCGIAATAALAQATPTGAAPASPPAYRSAFDGYQRFSEEKTTPWPQSNEAVREAGGWRAYAREAAQPPAPGASAPPSKPGAADSHGAHPKP